MILRWLNMSFANIIYLVYISQNLKHCIDIVSSTSFQRRIFRVVLFLVVWFDKKKIVKHQTKNWLIVSKEYDLRNKSNLVDISQNFQWSFNVELLTSFGRHVFNVLLTLKFFDYFSTSCFQRLTDVDIFVVQRLQPNSTY